MTLSSMLIVQDIGLAILPWSPLAGGFLSGKYHRETASSSDFRLAEPPEQRRRSKRLAGQEQTSHRAGVL